MSASPRARVRAGVPAGGQFAAARHADPAIDLDPDAVPTQPSIVNTDSVLTKRYDTLDEKLAAVQGELAAAVAALRDDDEWNRYLETMRRFHTYSPGNQIL